MKTFIVLNPAADQGSANERVPEIESLLKEHGVEYTLAKTDGTWHAADLAVQAASDGYEVVAVAGGDGTANEVINGLMRIGSGPEDRPAIHCFTIGRGNDFAYGVGLPTDLSEAVKLLVGGKTSLFDIGYLKGGDFPDGRYFGNGIGIGFDAVVGFQAAKMTNLTGFPAYAAAAFKTLLIYPDAPEIDLKKPSGDMHLQSHQISIMNGRRMGGGFYMAPNAKADDGKLDLCMSVKLNRRQMISMILKFMKGTQGESDLIMTEQGTSYQVSCTKGSLAIHADGETICENGSSLTVECVPAQLRVLSG